MEKKLLIITGNLDSGGLERVTANLANQYADMGWKVRIVCLLDPNKNIFYQFKDNIEISFFDKFYKNEALGRIEKVFLINKWIKFIRKEVKAWQPTNILTMTLKICALTSIACKKEKNIRIVMREIIDPKGRSQFINKICFRICKDVDHIIFQTNWERQCYPKNLQVKGSIILNPAEVNVIATEPKKKIVTMGRLALKQKQQNVLIDAFSIFVKNQPDFILEIYGEGNDKAKIEQMIEKKVLEIMFI